jgi:hypothetical protein
MIDKIAIFSWFDFSIYGGVGGSVRILGIQDSDLKVPVFTWSPSESVVVCIVHCSGENFT